MYTHNLGKLNKVNLRNTVCDGDVLVTKIDLALNDPLKDAVFTGLNNGIAAPKLPNVHFFKTQDLRCVFIKYVGHLHLFMRMFFLNGRVTLHKEIHGDKYNAPLDIYNHLLEEDLLRFSNPTVTEQKTTVFHYLKFRISGQHEIRGRLMSPIQVAAARTSKPFLFWLHAVLVLTSF